MVPKIYVPCPHVIYTGTGAVGIAQILNGHLRDQWAKGAYKSIETPEAAMHKLGMEIAALVTPYMQLAQVQRQLVGDAAASLTKSMIAFPVKRKPHLFTFDFNGAPEMASERLPFVALGSGQPIADPFLAFLARVLWVKRQPTLAEGRLAAAWTIDHVCRTNPGGVGGDTCMAILQQQAGDQPKVVEIGAAELQEHQQRISGAEKAIADELHVTIGEAETSLPAGPGTLPT